MRGAFSPFNGNNPTVQVCYNIGKAEPIIAGATGIPFQLVSLEMVDTVHWGNIKQQGARRTCR